MRKSVLASIAIWLATMATFAQAPRTIPFQGRLTNAAGAPLPDGPYDVNIALYSAPSGGTAIWSESKSVSTVRGQFTTAMGSDTPFPAGVTFDTPLYVGVTLPPTPEMTPRLPLLAVPYAIGLALPTQATISKTTTALTIINTGSGGAITGRHTSTSGTEAGVRGETSSVDSSAYGVIGVVTSLSPGSSSAAVRGVNNSTGTSGYGVYGSQAGSGWGVYGSTVSGVGVYGFTAAGVGLRGQSTTGNGTEGISGSGVGVYASSSTGVAGQFVTSSGSADAISVTQSGSGRGVYVSTTSGIGVSATSGTGAAGQFSTLSGSTADTVQINQLGAGRAINVSSGAGNAVYATASSGTAVYGLTISSGNPAILGENSKGEAVTGRATTDTSGAVVGRNDGAGPGVKGYSTKTGPGVYGAGGLSGGIGPAGVFEILNAQNSSYALDAKSIGTGYAIHALATGTANDAIHGVSTGGHGVYGSTNGASASGVEGYNTAGVGVTGISFADGSGAVVGRNEGNGFGVYGYTDGSGPGVYGQNGVVADNTGPAGRFSTTYTGATANTLEVTSIGSGNTLVVNHSGTGTSTTTLRNLAVFQTYGANRARIDNTGKGYFNGGTQSSGADVAEAFAVEGTRAAYEPGDVLVISERTDRTMEKSAEAYSTRVAGVVATKPGALLTERDTDADLSDLVPLGVVGVIPTKVCADGGPIHRGDLLVTSSHPGVAMKAGANPPPGSVLGKALAPFDGPDPGRINVLVNVR